MTPTQTVKQYGEFAVAQGRTLAEQARTARVVRTLSGACCG